MTLNQNLENLRKNLSGARILILGFGREGVDTFLFLRKLFPNKTLGIADKNLKLKTDNLRLKNVKWHLGKNYLKSLKNYDIIIKTPGIPIHLPEIEKAFKQKKITSQTKIFLQNCPGTIVGITGTKGKSTTTALIYNILKRAKKSVYLVGNIGKPVLSYLLNAKKSNIFIYELSCHQLYNLKKSPHVAVFLNIFPEHLDYYKNLKEYSRAKSNITVHQNKNDYLVFNSGDKIVKGFAQKSRTKKIPIQGNYYDLDRKAATAVAKTFKVPQKIIEKTIKEFKPLPHRLELVGKFHGITFYNDALSTIPETAIFAINFLGKNVQTIVLGGFDRNIKFENLAKIILKSKIKNAIFFPTTGEKIWEEINKQAPALAKATVGRQGKKSLNIKPFFTDNMKDAVKIAYKNTEKGKICLLSTASTSFSIFRDYREKGDLFKKFVKQFAKK